MKPKIHQKHLLGLLFEDKISTILEDKHVRKKRGHICPEDTLRTILSV